MAFLEIENVVKTYNPNGRAPVQALRGVGFGVEKGEMLAIQGRSGSGKSTLMHILGLIDAPTSGSYRIDGQPTETLSDGKRAEYRNRRFGFVLQQFGLIDERRAWENVSLPLLFARGRHDAKARSLKALETVGLADLAQRRAWELSGGERQRVAIARALVNDPDVLLADEPTGSLDSRTSEQILSLFERLNAAGKTVLIVTHDDAVAKRCRRVLRLYDGVFSE